MMHRFATLILRFAIVVAAFLGTYLLIVHPINAPQTATHAVVQDHWNAFESIFGGDFSDPRVMNDILRKEYCLPAQCFKRLQAAAALQQHNHAHTSICGGWNTSYTSFGPQKSQKVFVALNLRDSEAVMPHFIRQLLHLAAHLGPDHLFISIYESASSDRTPIYLQFLAKFFVRCGISHRILGGSSFTKPEDVARTYFLAQVRNFALEPLWGGSAALTTNCTVVSNSGDPTVLADRVVFINDVYWCVKHVLRLLAYDADLACGMDYYVLDVLQLRTFYDIWVSRAVDGQLLSGRPPYVRHPLSARLLAHGRAIPMRCCWNGLAVMRARPFMEGVRFKAHEEGECVASECSILCDQLRHRKYNDVVMDPAVALAYDVQDARALALEPRLNGLFWLGQDTAAAYRHGMREAHANATSVCCDYHC